MDFPGIVHMTITCTGSFRIFLQERNHEHKRARAAADGQVFPKTGDFASLSSFRLKKPATGFPARALKDLAMMNRCQ
jgi:hypothetical protein